MTQQACLIMPIVAIAIVLLWYALDTRVTARLGKTVGSLRAYLAGTEGDMVERGLIMVAIVVAAVGLWYALGAKLAAKLSEVVGSF